MIQYLAYFKLRFITGLQYRAAAVAGIGTQFFFGIIFIMIYMAFYESNPSSVPMELPKLITYLWISQAVYSLTYIYHREPDIINMIKSGNVCYELCRPGNLYIKWFCKIYATKLASVLLKFAPIIIIGILLPSPYKLMPPDNLLAFFGFLSTLFLGSLLITTFVTLLHILIFYTIDCDGVLISFRVIAELFQGAIVPVVFLPRILQTISKFLPFQYMYDTPIRIYVGNIPTNSILYTLLIQFIWIIVLIIIGLLLSKNALKKVVIQGG